MKIGVIGTGLMGFPMSQRLLECGHQVTVYNRTREKAEPLEESGAELAGGPYEVVLGANLTLVMLTDAGAIWETLQSRDELPDLGGRTLCQTSTIAPGESLALQAEIERAGGTYFEAPVLGSRPQARNGKLLVMVGAEPEQFERWRPLLHCLGENPLRIGEVGQAAALKLAFNQLIAAELTGFATALGLVRHHGIEVEQFMALLRQSALYAPTFDAKLPRFLSGDFDEPNFPARLLLKDLDLAREEASTAGLDTAALEGLCEVVRRALEQSLGDYDYSVIAAVIDPHRS